MADLLNAAATPETVATETPSVIKDAGLEVTTESTVLDDAGKAQQQATEAEEKRLLEANDVDLSADDKAKKDSLVKKASDKKLLETPEDQLNDEQKAKKAELIKAQEAEKNKASEVPEKYEFKLPEGMELDQTLVDKVTPIFKEHKLSQTQAQAMVDIYNEQMALSAKTQEDNFKKFLKDSYEETVKALGPDYKKEIAFVAKVRDKFFSKESQEMFEATGMANNKPFIMDLIKMGKLISEDKLVDGKSMSEGKDPASVLYPGQGKT